MYLKTMTIIVTVLILLSSLTNWLIDPYRIFFSPEIKNINIKKPRAQAQIYINRAAGIKHNNASQLLLGNSLVHWGLHAKSPYWSQDTYNAAIAGSNIYTSYKYLVYATQNTAIKEVVLGVDYYSFLTEKEFFEKNSIHNPRIIGDFESYLTDGSFMKFTQHAKRLISLDTVFDSLITLQKQNSVYSEDITSKGDNPVNEYKEYVNEKGHFKLFSDYLNNSKNRLLGDWRIFNEKNESQEFEILRKIVNHCQKHNINLTLYIHPYHAEMLMQIVHYNRWDEFVNWKIKIANILKNYPDVLLWDFSGINKYTSEPIPLSGDNSPMKWYWEPAHYKNTLGDEIIKRIKNPSDQSDGFGKRIFDVSDIIKTVNPDTYTSILEK